VKLETPVIQSVICFWLSWYYLNCPLISRVVLSLFKPDHLLQFHNLNKYLILPEKNEHKRSCGLQPLLTPEKGLLLLLHVHSSAFKNIYSDVLKLLQQMFYCVKSMLCTGATLPCI
jgi:hypothetical protein